MRPPEGAVIQFKSSIPCTFTFVTVGGDIPEPELVLHNCTFMFAPNCRCYILILQLAVSKVNKRQYCIVPIHVIILNNLTRL